MRAKDTFSQAQLRLQAAGCRYRIKQAPRSPYIQVYDTLPPRRQQAARGFRVDDDQACWDLAALLLKAHERGVQGGPVLIWDELETATAGGPMKQQQSWGEICAMVQSWIAPGGPKARDRNPFTCFRPNGYFGRNFDPNQIATTRQLEEFCLYTPASLQLWKEDPGSQLILRQYNSKGFYGVIQMVNTLAQRGIAIATPELQAKLDRLKKGAGKLRAPAPRFIPRTDDIQSWLDQLQQSDPLRGWVMAVIATYGSRGHIDPDSQVPPPSAGADVGDVAPPAEVRSRGLERLLQQVFNDPSGAVPALEQGRNGLRLLALS